MNRALHRSCKPAGAILVALAAAFAAYPAEPIKPAPAQTPNRSDELFTNSVIPHLRIEIPPAGMEVLRAYQWEWGGNSWARTNAFATVREGSHVYTNVAVHLKGAAGSFRSIDSDNPALTLNFDKVADHQRFHGLQKIHLNNSVQDPTLVCEQLARELFNAAGIPAPRAAHAVVQLNGRDLGLYVLVEGWNKQFLKRHFQNPKGNLYDGGFGKDIDRPLEVNSGDRPDERQRLQDLAKICREEDLDHRWTDLQQVLDIDRFLTFIALEIMLCHWDGYAAGHNNYRLYHDLDSDRFVFMPHGLDQLFGTFRSTPESRITPMMKGIAARAVMQIPEARRHYLQRMSQLLTTVFNADALTRRADAIAATLRPFMNDAEARRHEQFMYSLKDRIQRRVRSVTAQIKTAMTPLAFDASNSANLSGWESRRDSGNPSFDGARVGKETLGISAPGTRAYGSWRTSVLLDAGEYQFTGRARTDGLKFGAGVTNGGVTLRYSGDRKARMVTNAVDWTTLTYDFTVAGLTDIELVCELRATSGRVWFDANSLKLHRKADVSRP